MQNIKIEERISPKINVSFEIKPIVINFKITKHFKRRLKKLSTAFHFANKHNTMKRFSKKGNDK